MPIRRFTYARIHVRHLLPASICSATGAPIRALFLTLAILALRKLKRRYVTPGNIHRSSLFCSVCSAPRYYHAEVSPVCLKHICASLCVRQERVHAGSKPYAKPTPIDYYTNKTMSRELGELGDVRQASENTKISQLGNLGSSAGKFEGKAEGKFEGKSETTSAKHEGATESSAGKTEGNLGKVEGQAKAEGNLGKAEGDLGKSQHGAGKTEGNVGKAEGNLGKAEGNLGKAEGNIGKFEGQADN